MNSVGGWWEPGSCIKRLVAMIPVEADAPSVTSDPKWDRGFHAGYEDKFKKQLDKDLVPVLKMMIGCNVITCSPARYAIQTAAAFARAASTDETPSTPPYRLLIDPSLAKEDAIDWNKYIKTDVK